MQVLEPLKRQEVFPSTQQEREGLTSIGAGVVHSHVAHREDGHTGREDIRLTGYEGEPCFKF